MGKERRFLSAAVSGRSCAEGQNYCVCGEIQKTYDLDNGSSLTTRLSPGTSHSFISEYHMKAVHAGNQSCMDGFVNI